MGQIQVLLGIRDLVSDIKYITNVKCIQMKYTEHLH